MKNILSMLIALLAFSANATVIHNVDDITLGDFTGIKSMDQIDTGSTLFRLTDANGDNDDAAVFLMYLKATPFADISIYDPVTGNSLQVFNKGDVPLTSTSLSWNIFTDEVTNEVTRDTAIIDWESFAFQNGNWSSIPEDSDDGRDHLSVFNTLGSGEPTLLGAHVELVWYPEIEAGLNGNYSMVGATDIQPNVADPGTTVPEANLALMLGIALVGIGYTKKIL